MTVYVLMCHYYNGILYEEGYEEEWIQGIYTTHDKARKAALNIDPTCDGLYKVCFDEKADNGYLNCYGCITSKSVRRYEARNTVKITEKNESWEYYIKKMEVE